MIGYGIPDTVRSEHEELHGELGWIIQEGGELGAAAEIVARLIERHFIDEEAYALPPLRLLPQLIDGAPAAETGRAILMGEKLELMMPRLLEQHRRIGAALGDFVQLAKIGHRPELVQLAEKLMALARHEEEVLYPAALLVGRYVQLALREVSVP